MNLSELRAQKAQQQAQAEQQVVAWTATLNALRGQIALLDEQLAEESAARQGSKRK